MSLQSATCASGYHMEVKPVNHKESMRFAHLFDKKPRGEDFFFHFHNDFEFLFFIDGNADFAIENKVYSLKKNDLLVIRPAQRHKLCMLSTVPYERYVFNFKKNSLAADEIDFLETANPVYHIGKNSVIGNLFENLTIAQNIYENEDFERLKLISLHSMITDMKYLPKSNEFVLESSLIGKIIEYINDHIEEPLTAQILADKFFLSRSSVDRECQKELNISCKQYINKKKIMYAQSLIMRGVPAAKAAETCAYENYTTFYRQYKAILGIYPLRDRLDVNDN